jgi:hypothetical protein
MVTPLSPLPGQGNRLMILAAMGEADRCRSPRQRGDLHGGEPLLGGNRIMTLPQCLDSSQTLFKVDMTERFPPGKDLPWPRSGVG